MASGSWERDRVGLEVRGGSSDFWATDGEPTDQFNRYFMSSYRVLVLPCAPDTTPTSSAPGMLPVLTAPLPAPLPLTALQKTLWNGTVPSAK